MAASKMPPDDSPEDVVPSSMSDALACSEPAEALLKLAEACEVEAHEAATILESHLGEFKQRTLPTTLQNGVSSGAIQQATSSADSVHASLVKIASGGSAASQEIQQLENSKARLDEEAAAVELALTLRESAQRSQQSHQSQSYKSAAEALQPWLAYRDDPNKNERVSQYAGEYILRQLDGTLSKIQSEILNEYRHAVQRGDLQAIGKYTPLLGMLQQESQAVQLYLEYLQTLWTQTVNDIQASSTNKGLGSLQYMAKIYNAAVSILRHHLPMVSQCLHKASGDVALVQWIHAQVQDHILKPIEDYGREKSLSRVVRQARDMANTLSLEDDWSSHISQSLGSLPDIDATCQEMATLVQHAESYLRFIRHACEQVRQARELRGADNINVLPSETPLHLAVTELGAQYAEIERCLFLASLHRSLVTSSEVEEDDPSQFKPLKEQPQALQTVLPDTSWYAARRSTTRALATGHVGTASTAVIFISDGLSDLSQVLLNRAQEQAQIVQGDGLLAGALFGGQTLLKGSTGPADNAQLEQRRKLTMDIARACAFFNDLRVGKGSMEQLERLVQDSISKSYSQQHEQMDACTKKLTSSTESFEGAADGAVDHLEQKLRSRTRGVVSQALGTNDAMANILVGKSSESGLHMNYNLDEEAYNMSQLAEGYMSRLLMLLDELLDPLSDPLQTSLWDSLLLKVWNTVAKRIESVLVQCQVSNLGAFLLDADVRELHSHLKTKLNDETQASASTLGKQCPGLARLLHISKLVCVDDLEDVLDLVAASKRKGQWDLKHEEVVSFLCLRTEFDDEQVKTLLQGQS